MSKYILIAIIIITHTARSSVDILSEDGIVFVAWSAGNQSHLIVSDSSAVRNFTAPDMTIGEIHANGDLYISCALSNSAQGASDSLYLLDPYALSTESAYELDYQDFIGGSYLPDEVYMSIRIARHSINDTPVLVSSKYTAYDYQTGELGVTTARFVPDTCTMELILSEVRGAILPFYYASIKSLSRPMSCCQPEPMCFWHLYFDWHGISNIFYSGIHEIPQYKFLGLSTDQFLYDQCYYQYEMPRLKAAGSCTSEILTLWISTFDDTMYCTTFDAAGPEPTESVQFPYAKPPPEAPWAMSCNPDDTGLLFAWIDEGSIMCRYYSGEWNPETHTVQSGLTLVEDGNLAVCSDQYGYWIAWMEESARSEPQFIFVPRDSVTAIDDSYTQPDAAELNISPVTNPLQGLLSLNVTGCEGTLDLFVYDVSGRLELHRIFNNEDDFIITEELPPGAYIVRVVNGTAFASCKVIVL